jgi:hypothetical protein
VPVLILYVFVIAVCVSGSALRGISIALHRMRPLMRQETRSSASSETRNTSSRMMRSVASFR